MSKITFDAAIISAPKCKFTPTLSQSEFFCSAIYSFFWRTQLLKLTELDSPDKTAGAAFSPEGISLRQNGCRYEIGFPGGIYRTKDTSRSKQSVKEKGWVCQGLLRTKWDAFSLKDVHWFWWRLRSGGAADAKYKPSYEISKIITKNIMGPPGQLNRRDPHRSGHPLWTEGSRTETEGRICC